MKNNYTKIHMHSMLSNPTTVMDSITHFKDYIDKAKECGMTSICFTEHGNIYEWLHKKEYCESQGLKYIHGVEAYVTESLVDKTRDNYHVVLIAKNYEGVKEINYLMSDKIAFNRGDGHFYYAPRISYDELKNTSDNIIISSACLGGILNKGNIKIKKDFIKFMMENKHRCYLEIQHHEVEDQIAFNKQLYAIHKKTNIPLILGTDTHALNKEHMEGRTVLQRAKNTYFANEEGWNLSFVTYEELIECCKRQDALPLDVYLEAIENTNVLSDSIEEFEVDRSHKYPVMHLDAEKVLKDKIKHYAKERNIKLTREINNRIKHEFQTYKTNGAIDYLLLEEDIKSWCRKNDIFYGYSRGSVSGSYIAYLLKITDMDSVKYDLNFERFMNPDRVSLADIDTDYPPSQRGLVKEYIFNKRGLYCADIITFNTVALKGAIRDVGRAFNMPLDEVDVISKSVETEEDGLREKYPKLFKYVDLLNGVIVSVGQHPCGLLISPHPIEGNVGTFTTTTSEYPITQLNMKELDSLNFVKLDILGLDNIEIINETCKLAGIERMTPDNTDYEDWDVWKSIRDSTLSIFQWESSYCHDYYKQLFSDETLSKIRNVNPNISYIDLFSIGNGAIRPAGDSYRDALGSGEFKDNGHIALNEFLSPTNGFLVFQEQIIKFLNEFCGFTMGQADIVRRGFAKKSGTEEYLPRIKKGFIETMKDKYNTSKEESEEIIISFIQVIEDASRYLFSSNHSDPYSRIGYTCAWLRYYYPLEFLTVVFDINKNNQEKVNRTMEYMREFTNIKQESIKFRYSRAGYSHSKETNTIYKGISSIKYLNEKVSEELYELKGNQYNSFFDLLIDVNEKTSLNSRQLKILIELDFFIEFGKSKKLLTMVEYFENIYGRKQIKKDNIKELNIPYDLIKNNSKKETEKLFKEINIQKILISIEGDIEDKSIGIKDRLDSELENLGYLEFTHPSASSTLYYVSEFKVYKNKAKPYVDLYQIKTGETTRARITKDSLFIEQPFDKCGIIDVERMSRKPKMKKINGEWERSKTEFNNIIDSYNAY